MAQLPGMGELGRQGQREGQKDPESERKKKG